LADHINSGWQLIKQIRMEFPVPLELEEDVESEDIAAEISENVNTSRNNSDSLITTTLNNKDLIDSVVVISNNAKSRNYSDFEANLKEFKQQGIARNRRTEALARMKHVNPEYICAHMKGLKRKDSKGLAIMRMEQGEEAPERTKDMLSPEEIRAKYAEWER
jgi:hypothetical protein